MAEPQVAEGERAALEQLLAAAQRVQCDFAVDASAVLAPVAAEALPQAGFLVRELCESLGWDGARFGRPLNVPLLISRLKALAYDGLEIKGQGSYATVFRGRNRLSGEVVTLKKLRLDHAEEGLPAQAIREVSLLRELDHPHIVRLLDVLWDEKRLFMVLEYLDHDLRQHLDTCPEASHPANVRRYMWQILQGLEHMHARGVLHRDLKPQNVLVDAAANACKIADLGLGRAFVLPARPYSHEVVTLLYRAPEVLLGCDVYGTSLDVWSAGCILFELATGEPLFRGETEIAQLFSIFQLLGTPSEATWPGVGRLRDFRPGIFPRCSPRDLHEAFPQHDLRGQLGEHGLHLLRRMLVCDPAQRISARAALEHPYFQGLQPCHQPGTPSQQSSLAALGSSSSDTDVLMAAETELPTASSGPFSRQALRR